MGHVLGLTNVIPSSPCRVSCDLNAVYTCPKALAEYNALGLKSTLMVDVPSCAHWSENSFPQSTGSSELMTPVFESSLAQPLTRVSIAALEEATTDYVVDYSMSNSFPYTGMTTSDRMFKALVPESTFNLVEGMIELSDPIPV